jgi:2'-5' RNA ligase
MTQSVELLLDATAERRVLDDWQILAEAGLPSLARHRSPSNRPHVTLAAVARVEPAQEAALVEVVRDRLPVTGLGGPLTIFGRDRLTLVRVIAASRAILDLHLAVAAVLALPSDDLAAPGRWVPHVTLARRLPAAQLPRAVELLAPDDLPVHFEVARRWDSDQRQSWPVPPGPSSGSSSIPRNM